MTRKSLHTFRCIANGRASNSSRVICGTDPRWDCRLCMLLGLERAGDRLTMGDMELLWLALLSVEPRPDLDTGPVPVPVPVPADCSGPSWTWCRWPWW